MSNESYFCNRIYIIGNQAFSLQNFRGLLIEDMARRGHDVIALALDCHDDIRAAIRTLGAEPVNFSPSFAGINPLRNVADMIRLAIIFRRPKPYIWSESLRVYKS